MPRSGPTPESSLPLRRRTLLIGASLGALGAALASIGWRLGRTYAPTGRTYLHLTQGEATMIEALAETMSPGDGTSPSPKEINVAGYIDAHMDRLSTGARTQLRAMFWLFEHGTLVFAWSWKRFTDLDDAAKLQYLQSWMDSPNGIRRSLMLALRGALGFAYFSHPRVEAILGITHKCMSWHTLHDPTTRVGAPT